MGFGFLGRKARRFATGARPTKVPPRQEPSMPGDEQLQETVRPQTGAAPQPEPTQEYLDESIYDLGAVGPMGPEEAASLEGRTYRRNINLNFFKDDSTKRVMEYANAGADGFRSNPKRRPVSHKETLGRTIMGAEDSAELTARLERITGSPLDTKWEPEDLVSIYQLLDTQAKEIHSLASTLKAQRTSGIEPATEDLAHYQLMLTRFTATQEIASVRAAEAGRMLNALQAVSKSVGDRQYYRDMQQLISGAGGKSSLFKSIDNIADADPSDIKDLAARARQSWGAKAWNTAVQVRYNAMLSSLRTHGANIAGSIASGVLENVGVNPSRVLLNNLEYVTRAMVKATFGKGGMDPADRIALSEIIDQPRDTIMAAREAFTHAKKVFKGEELGHGKVYNELGLRSGDPDQPGAGVLPRWAQTPTRMLEAEDAFFRSMYGHAELRKQAKREALRRATTNDEVNAQINSLMKSPTDDMLAAAADVSHRMTFTNDPSYYGEVLKTLANVGRTFQDTHWGRIVVPFVNTPANVLGYAMDNTAMGKFIAPRNLWRDLNSGPDMRADVEARFAIAAGLLMYLSSWWEEGNLTGAPPGNYGVLRAREAGGWRANSIRVGDEYLQLDRMDPVGLMLGLAGTIFDTWAHTVEEDKPTAAAAGVIGLVSLLGDRSMLAGLGDLERVFKSSEGTAGRNLGKFAARGVTSFFIPGILRDVREMADPYKRSLDVGSQLGDAFFDSVIKSTMNAVPWLSDNLPPRVNAFGKDMIETSGTIYRGLVPFRRGEIKQDPVAASLAALDIPVNKPDYLIRHPRLGGSPPLNLLELDGNRGWLYREYQRAVGQMRYQLMGQLVNSAEWQDAARNNMLGPESQLAEKMRAVIRQGHKIATARFLEEINGKTSWRPTVGDERMPEVTIEKPFNLDAYYELYQAYVEDGATLEVLTEGKKQGAVVRRKPTRQGLPPELRIGN